MSNAACFTCLPEGVKPAVKLALLVRWLQALDPTYVLNVQTLLTRASCFLCLPEGLVQTIRLQLMCNILGGGTGPGCTAPLAPSNVSGNVDDPNPGDAFIQWSQAVDPDLDFLIKWGTTSGIYTDQSSVGPAFRGSDILQGFLPDTTYYFVVVARNSLTCISPNSNEVSFTTGPNPDPPLINLVPLMTSNVAPEGIASASSQTGGFPAYFGFDRNDSTTWLSTLVAPPHWLRYQFTSAVKVVQYQMHVAFPNLSPKTWTFEGSQNGIAWTVLDTQTGILTASWTANPTQLFVFANVTSYLYYRINISQTNNNLGDSVAVASLEMIG